MLKLLIFPFKYSTIVIKVISFIEFWIALGIEAKQSFVEFLQSKPDVKIVEFSFNIN